MNRRNVRRKRYNIRKIVNAILGTTGFLSFFYMLGIVGGIENDTIDLGIGFVKCLIALVIFALSIELYNYINEGRL